MSDRPRAPGPWGPTLRPARRAPEPRRGRIPAPLRRLLGVPLFYKILIANSAIVIGGAVAGTMVTAEFVRTRPDRSIFELVGLLATAGVVMSVLANALILRVALSPLRHLQRTASAIQSGTLDARAPVSPVADRDLARLIRTFNLMLDGLEGNRERLREIAARALYAEEEERKRIARELHDETAQSVAAILIRLRLMRGVEDAARREALLEEVREELASTLEGIRRYARGLRPPALDELGLVPAIQAYARTLAEGTGLAISVDAERGGGRLTPEAELALYRMVQEALSNVVRHAEATRARVHFRPTRQSVVVVVEDDGRGFPVDEVMEAGRGLGLFGMRERAGYVGGQVEIDSKVGEGTRVRITVPTSEEDRNG
ncbi:MAG TPA: ATP-binding protein [Longimicrobiales bacterium]